MSEKTETKDLHQTLSDMESDICDLCRLATALDLMGQGQARSSQSEDGSAVSHVAFIAVQTAERVKAAWLSAFELSNHS